MATQLTAEDARQSLTAHVATKGAELFAKYGPRLGWKELQLLLNDRAFVRYPCEIVFDASQLNPGEFAHPVAKGKTPEEGFVMHIHPMYMLDLGRVPYLVLYQLVAVNYGPFASADDAEIFGAAALGIPREVYYDTLCELADQLGVGELESARAGGCGGGGCGGGL
ncbi:MAG: hypothetical protein HY736_02455 [Verrucomicrobia bacterium]|nr:hypothetical protein [Verrucomicrobiota bacterium]